MDEPTPSPPTFDPRASEELRRLRMRRMHQEALEKGELPAGFVVGDDGQNIVTLERLDLDVQALLQAAFARATDKSATTSEGLAGAIHNFALYARRQYE